MTRNTRTRILVSSLLLFNENGEPNTTTNEIADEVDISPGNLYYHFNKKSDLVDALLLEFQADAKQVLRPPESQQASLDDFWVFLHLLLELTAAYRFLLRDMESLIAEYPKVGNALKHFARGLAASFELYLHALLAGGQAVKSHFATLPTSFAELQSGKVHNVLTSYDVLGGRHSTVAMYNKEEWKKANPKMYECVWTSYRKAMEWINGNKKDAAALFQRFTKSKLKLEDIEKMVGDENEMLYSLTPERTMEFAKFMHSIGAIKNMPASWKDYYWENNYDQNGG